MFKRIASMLREFCYHEDSINDHVNLIRNSSEKTIYAKLGVHPNIFKEEEQWENISPPFYGSPESLDY